MLRDQDDDDAELVPLKLLGSEGKKCDQLTFNGSLDKIEASIIQTKPGFFILNSVRYSRDKQKTYGGFLKPFSSEWKFNDTAEVIGLYGQTNPLENNAIV